MSGAAQAFIAFLRCEATQSEERAKSLRATAAAIEANNLEGRRRKRKRDATLKPKKAARSGYTLFVHENYNLVKKSQPADVPSKDIVAIVARQWGNTSEEEKAVWKVRAEQMKEQFAEPHPQLAAELDEASLPPEPVAALAGVDDGGGGKKKAVVKKSSAAKNITAMPV